MNPDISYIVSAYNRPDQLRACLWSLYGQKHGDFEVLVTDNSLDPEITAEHRKVIAEMGDNRYRYLRTAGKTKVNDCYWAAEYAAARARGKWLCFPCDDCYYLPTFGSEMLSKTVRDELDFVESWCLIGIYGGSTVFNANHTVKSSFLIRAELFKRFGGFVAKPKSGVAACADRVLGEMARKQAKCGTVPMILVVHN